jgi:hypothetical protein
VRYDGDRVGNLAQPALTLTRVLGLIWQLAIIYILDKAYEATRGIIPHQENIALRHALAVVGIEKSWHIFDEWWVQAVVFRHAQWHFGPLTIDRGAIISLVNHFYLYSHFVGTPAFLVWLYLFRRKHFRFVRDVIVITTSLALVIYIVFPMMPPRLMGAYLDLPHHYHIQDTLAPILNYKLQQAQIGYNPYAAMPSLHFAWALILGVTLVLLGRHVLRLVGLLYPVMMLATILISGNHLLLDAAGSVIVVTVAVLAALVLHRRLSPRQVFEGIGRATLAA